VARSQRSWFKRGKDSRRCPGRKKGARNKLRVYAYHCPYCHKEIGPVNERKGLTLDRIKDRLLQQRKLARYTGQVRKGRRGFEKGYDPARNMAGRLIGKPNRAPRVPSRCDHCGQRIVAVWRNVMVKRYLRSGAVVRGFTPTTRRG
jgi:DNA-directed RNA polymerase subunit RPC12/RpoP